MNNDFYLNDMLTPEQIDDLYALFQVTGQTMGYARRLSTAFENILNNNEWPEDESTRDIYSAIGMFSESTEDIMEPLNALSQNCRYLITKIKQEPEEEDEDQ